MNLRDCLFYKSYFLVHRVGLARKEEEESEAYYAPSTPDVWCKARKGRKLVYNHYVSPEDHCCGTGRGTALLKELSWCLMCWGPAASWKWNSFSILEEEPINNLKVGSKICWGLFIPVMYWIVKGYLLFLRNCMDYRCVATHYRFTTNRLCKQPESADWGRVSSKLISEVFLWQLCTLSFLKKCTVSISYA